MKPYTGVQFQESVYSTTKWNYDNKTDHKYAYIYNQILSMKILIN